MFARTLFSLILANSLPHENIVLANKELPYALKTTEVLACEFKKHAYNSEITNSRNKSLAEISELTVNFFSFQLAYPPLLQHLFAPTFLNCFLVKKALNGLLVSSFTKFNNFSFRS